MLRLYPMKYCKKAISQKGLVSCRLHKFSCTIYHPQEEEGETNTPIGQILPKKYHMRSYLVGLLQDGTLL